MNKPVKPENIHARIYKFVVRVIKFTKKLPRTAQNLVMITQLVKSATSMGANDQEADVAESRKDFNAKYTIVKKETNETNYWLRIIRDTNGQLPQIVQEANELISEGSEIFKIVRSIVIKTKFNH